MENYYEYVAAKKVDSLSAFETAQTFESTSGKEIAVSFLVIQKKYLKEGKSQTMSR